MNTHRFFVEKIRFHLKEKNKLVFVGWFFDGSTQNHNLEAFFGGEKLPLQLQVNRGAEIRQKYLGSIHEIIEEVVGIITLPRSWREGGRLCLFSSYKGKRGRAYTISAGKMKRLETEISYYIENYYRENGMTKISGWCMGEGEVTLALVSEKGEQFPQRTTRYYRKDLRGIYPECEEEIKPGFLLEGETAEGDALYLEMRSAKQAAKVRLRKWQEGTSPQNKLCFATKTAEDAMRYFRRNGLSATLFKVSGKLRNREGISYDWWRKKYAVTPEELQEQRKQHFPIRPLFSIIVPAYKTNPIYLRKLLSSVLEQTYAGWELCIAQAESPELIPVLEEYVKKDGRIRYCTLERNEGISANTNAALDMARGDFIVLADHDDIIAANALYEFAAAINQDVTIDVLYSDEDKISMDGRKYFEPHFKPDFNPDLLCSFNYICHLFAVKREVLLRAGQFDGQYDGAQDLDFILRCTEQAKNIYHVPRILYHWRCHPDSTASNPESKRYAFEAGRRAVQMHYERLGIPARVEHAQFYGMYRTRYLWKDTPLVSIIIPNKDHRADLETCIDSILTKSEYRNFEIVVVENNSVEPETFAYYKRLTQEQEKVKVIYYEGGFNYSKINNFGVAAASGAYLLLLNNDTEMMTGDCITELLGYCMREDVGVVGSKLLYEDDTIQHAGVVLGFGGTAGHAFIGKSRYDTGYFGRLICAQDYSAVTAACMMTKRSVFEQVGGFTEALAVAFNDVDYCLKVRRAGKLVVYNPYAELRHYESKSRGYEDSPEKVERFNGEVEVLLSYWREWIEKGDPYYNPNLTLDNSDFSLRK
ncbi:MAG: glycosyltransferase family 2 protein [Clostridiales bacterium]|nr:glycosyltransferase family 2 protein [Clostridiales bacterium]